MTGVQTCALPIYKQVMIQELEKQMKDAAKVLDFERAMELRDIIMELQGEK